MVPIDDEWLSSCPETHPEELFYEIWPGTRGLCDCLEREGDRLYDLTGMCRRGKNAPHNSEDCLDVGPLAPIVQNKINGWRYCGRRSLKTFSEMIRPVKNDDPDSDQKYKCPSGYKACNEDFFDKNVDFVICIPENS